MSKKRDRARTELLRAAKAGGWTELQSGETPKEWLEREHKIDQWQLGGVEQAESELVGLQAQVKGAKGQKKRQLIARIKKLQAELEPFYEAELGVYE